jgi:hypothetical protein
MPVFAVTIFIGAFLLFQVQPLIGKYILPWFGGGPGVWTTCMLFFQIVLLAGYAYAHFLTRYLRPRAQAAVHSVLLVAAMACLPIIPGDRWKPFGLQTPTLQILQLLSVCVGLPYFVLSATGPLIQQWFSRANPLRSPYRLYALSNIGSLLALLTYPFYFESHLTRKAQASMWAWGLLAYAIGCGACAFTVFRAGVPAAATTPEPLTSATAAGPCTWARWLQPFFWIALPASASLLLLAVTNKICQDVAVIPFLWVLPLALYLLSFIICFDSPRWYARLPYTLGLVAGLAAICWALFEGTDASIYQQVVIYSLGLFVCCMVCHGELYRLRPEPRRLTTFYLLIAAGGALGGLLAAVVAPLIFDNFFELHWGLFLCALLFLFVCLLGQTDPATEQRKFAVLDRWQAISWSLLIAAIFGLDWFIRHFGPHIRGMSKPGILGTRVAVLALFTVFILSWIARGHAKAFRQWRALSAIWLTLGVGVLGAVLWKQAHSSSEDKVSTTRNFYGVLSVYEHRRDEPDGHHFLLQHGRITHGLQFVDPELARKPTTYYGESSGVGLAVHVLPPAGRRIGVIGLGTGSMAVYGRAGDYLRIYEINPQVRTLATTRFTYVNNCPALVDIVMGDARLSMERDTPQDLDLLVLDAFSSDAIPVHLLTKESFEVYLRHLKQSGIIAVHISNHYLDLEPVVVNVARHFGFRIALIDFEENEDEWWLYASSWILLTRDPNLFTLPPIKSSVSTLSTNSALPLWTDDFSSLFQILKK